MKKYATIQTSWITEVPPNIPLFTAKVTSDIADLTDGKVKDIRVWVQLMPSEYNRMESDSEEAKAMIEADADRGASLTSILGGPGGGVVHPYEEGMWIFPEGHPLAAVERRARLQNDDATIQELQAAAPKLKELSSGSDREG